MKNYTSSPRDEGQPRQRHRCAALKSPYRRWRTLLRYAGGSPANFEADGDP